MLKLTEEEQVYAKQLFAVRQQIRQLTVEADTQRDKLLTILRGHQAESADAGEYRIYRSITTHGVGKTFEDVTILIAFK